MKTTTLRIFIASMLCFSAKVIAQMPTYTFAKQIRATFGGADARIEAIDVDPTGNICVTGLMDGTDDFDPGVGSYNLTATGIQDAYVAKYDNTGAFLWAYHWGANSNLVNGNGIAFDSNGNIFITGIFNANTDFDPGPGVTMINAGPSFSHFICKYSSNGTFLWAKAISNVTGNGGLMILKTDLSGNFYLSSNFNGTVDFDLSPSVYNLTSTPGGYDDIYIAKYDNNGNLLFAKSVGGAYTDYAYNLTLDVFSNILICGMFNQSGPINQTADFDPGVGVANLTSSSAGGECYFAKYDSNGNYIWAKSLNGTGSYEYVSGITSDPSGNVFISGLTRGTTDFDPGVGVFNLTPAFDGIFFGRYDSGGNFQWANMIQPTNSGGNNAAKDICYDSNGNIIIGGDFGLGTVDADPGAGTFTLTNSGAPGPTRDMFLSIYTNGGNFVSAFNVGSPLSSTENNCMQIGVFNSDIYVVGQFGGTEDFDPSGATNNLVSGSVNVDGYFAKYNNPCIAVPSQPAAISGLTSICENTTNTYSVTAVAGASSYTWSLPGGWTGSSVTNSINATASATSGNVTVTANNACGSSVAQTLAVTVNSIPATPGTISGPASICENSSTTYSITAVNGAATYTWTLPNGWTGNSVTNSINTTANATSGNITVTATNACGTSAAQTLAVTVNSIYSVNTTTSICQGDSIVLAGAYKKNAGVYTDLLQSINGCDSTVITTLTVNPLPTVTLGAFTAVCADAAAFALTGGAPAGGTYSGVGVNNNQFDAAVAGAGTHTITYTYTDANTGCSNSATNTIVVNPLPPVPTISVNMSTFTSSAASGNQWYLNGNPINGATNQTYTITMNGNYMVCVTDANGCKSCSAVLNFTSSGINENQLHEISVYPNPFNQNITVEWEKGQGTGEIVIFDLIGEKIYSHQLVSQTLTINLEEVPTGIYFLQVKNENGIVTKKIIKQ